MKLFCAGIGLNTPDLTEVSRAIKSSEAELCEKNGVTPLENLIVMMALHSQTQIKLNNSL